MSCEGETRNNEGKQARGRSLPSVSLGGVFHVWYGTMTRGKPSLGNAVVNATRQMLLRVRQEDRQVPRGSLRDGSERKTSRSPAVISGGRRDRMNGVSSLA